MQMQSLASHLDTSEHLQCGLDRLRSGDLTSAIEFLNQALINQPDNPDIHCAIGDAYRRSNQLQRALHHFEQALVNDSSHFSACHGIAKIKLSGPNYYNVLAEMIRVVQPKTYLEIGVSTGRSLGQVPPPTIAVGIDPKPQIKGDLLGPNHHLITKTSDEYFKSGIHRRIFADQPLDFGFIDGMHLFEFALRDFIAIERVSGQESIIVLHDCYPLNSTTSSRERQSLFWTGDVWKIVPCLKYYRPDLAIDVLPSPPSGLCVIRNLDPTSKVLNDDLDRIIEEFGSLDIASLGNEVEKERHLNLISMAEAKTRPYLRTG